MSADKNVSRRQFLAGSATAALTVGAVFAETPATAASISDAVLPRAPQPKNKHAVEVTDLEVLTATPTSLTFTWSTFTKPHTDHLFPGERVASDAEVWLAPVRSKQPLKCVHRSYSDKGLHFVTITGLKPDTEYRFSCRSFGKEAAPGFWWPQIFIEPEVTGKVRTLARPRGKHIQTLALCNDLHVGKINEVSGNSEWSSVMVAAMISELKNLGFTRFYANGDVTDHGKLEEATELRRLFDSFGKYHQDYFFTRGNHDAYNVNTETGVDPVQKVFPLHKVQNMWVTYDKKLRVIGIDTAFPGLEGGKSPTPSSVKLKKNSCVTQTNLPW